MSRGITPDPKATHVGPGAKRWKEGLHRRCALPAPVVGEKVPQKGALTIALRVSPDMEPLCTRAWLTQDLGGCAAAAGWHFVVPANRGGWRR